jgi:hypothetical protein
MEKKRVTMNKVREIIRLHEEMGGNAIGRLQGH